MITYACDASVATGGSGGGFSADIVTNLHSGVDVLAAVAAAGAPATTAVVAANASGGAGVGAGARVVVVTRSLIMALLRVCPDGRVLALSRAKLSVKVPAGVGLGGHRWTWAGPGLLATVSPEEAFVR